MSNKRKLVFEDETYPAHLQKHLKQLRPYLEKVKTEFEELEFEPFSNESLKEITSGNVETIKQRYIDKSLKEIKAAGITNSIIRDNMLKGIEEKVEHLKKAVQSLVSYNAPRSFDENRKDLQAEDVSFKNGEFVISEEDIETYMEESGRVYLETDQEHELYSSLNNFINSFDQVQTILKDAKYNKATTLQGLNEALLTKTEEGYRIRPSAVKSVLGYYEWQQSMRRKYS